MKRMELQREVTQQMTEDCLGLAVISNVTFEPFFSLLINKAFQPSKTAVSVQSIGYEEYAAEENVEKLKKADYVMVCLSFETLYPDAKLGLLSGKLDSEILLHQVKQECFNLLAHIRRNTQNPVFWFGFEDYCDPYSCTTGNVFSRDGVIDQINLALLSLFQMPDVLLDLKRIIANVGIKNAYDIKGKYRWNCPYSKELIAAICEEVYKQHLIHVGASRKCLVLDCDNVLWGGIVSEDGIEKIHLGGSGLGKSFQDFQRCVSSLYDRGVILAICSKNDLESVMAVFQNHSEMILTDEQIACYRVNWENKPENIKKIAEELNIGLDSIVFVDDSDFEIEAVRATLPEVTAIKYDRGSVHEILSCFHLCAAADPRSVQTRTDTYKTNVWRRELECSCQSFEEYLSALEMKLEIHRATPVELSRLAELTQRTNKWTNGKRYTVEKLQSLIQISDYKLFSVSLSDKFSNLGIVGAIGLQGAAVDLFSLSCRALGRGIENQLAEWLKRKKVTSYFFSSTGKNENVSSYFQSIIE